MGGRGGGTYLRRALILNLGIVALFVLNVHYTCSQCWKQCTKLIQHRLITCSQNGGKERGHLFERGTYLRVGGGH